MKDTIYLWNPDRFDDCGAFSDEDLNERDETIFPLCLQLEDECECAYYDELENKL